MALAQTCMVHTWVHNGNRYRLLRTDNHNNNGLVWKIERKYLDSLGDPQWRGEEDIYDLSNGSSSSRAACWLANVLSEMVLTQPELAAAHKLDGWPAVSDILRARCQTT